MPTHEMMRQATAVAGLVPKEIWLSGFDEGQTALKSKYRLRYDKAKHEKLEFIFMDAASFDQRWPNDEAHNGGRAGITVFRDDWCERLSPAQFQSVMIHEIVNMRQGVDDRQAPDDFEATLVAARWAQSARCREAFGDDQCNDAYVIQAREAQFDALDMRAWDRAIAQTQAALTVGFERAP